MEENNIIIKTVKCVEKARETGADASIVCSYVPRELIEAFGMKTVRVSAHGSVSSESEGEKITSPNVCSWCKSILGIKQKGEIIGCSSCDQMKRALEIDGRRNSRMPLIINMPATRSRSAREHYKNEIFWLVNKLEGLNRNKLDKGVLRSIISKRNLIRKKIRKIRSHLSAGELTSIIHLEYLYNTDEMLTFLDNLKIEQKKEKNPLRILVAGSPMAFEERNILEFIETLNVNIAADATCTGDRYIDFDVREEGDPLIQLANSYFEKAPCIWMRPNDEFYEYANKLIKERSIHGVIWHSVQFCDIWNLEFQRASEKLKLPILQLAMTYADITSSRIQTRIESFVENLS